MKKNFPAKGWLLLLLSLLICLTLLPGAAFAKGEHIHTPDDGGSLCAECQKQLAVMMQSGENEPSYYISLSEALSDITDGGESSYDLVIMADITTANEGCGNDGLTLPNANITINTQDKYIEPRIVQNGGSLSVTSHLPGEIQSARWGFAHLSIFGGETHLSGSQYEVLDIAVADTGLTIGSLLADGYGIKSGSTWYDSTYKATSVQDVIVQHLPIKNMKAESQDPQPFYGDNITLEASVDAYSDPQVSYLDYPITYKWTDKSGKELGTGSTCQVQGDDITDAANLLGVEQYTYYCSATIDGYTKTEPAVVIVLPLNISADDSPVSFTTQDGTYTGAALDCIVNSVTMQRGGRTLTLPTNSLIVNEMYTDVDSYTVTALGQGNLQGNKQGSWKINKSTQKPSTTNGELTIVNGRTDCSYQVDFGALLPAAPAGTFGTVEYSWNGANITDTGKYTCTLGSIDAATGKGSVIFNTATGEPGAVGTLVVDVTTQNYETFRLTIDVKSVEKIEPMLYGEASTNPTTLDLGAAISEISPVAAFVDPISGDTVSGKLEWVNPSEVPSTIGNNTADAKFTPDAADDYLPITVAVPFLVQDTLTDEMVKLTADFTYNGRTQEPALSVNYKGNKLVFTQDYTLSGKSSAMNAGDYQLTVTGMGKYKGSVTLDWSIARKPITPGVLFGEAAAEQTYTGLALTPAPTVVDGTLLTDDVLAATEYSVSYANNINVGTATVTVTDLDGGNYAITTATGSFKINKGVAPTVDPVSMDVYNSRQHTYRYDFSQLVPTLTQGEYGTIGFDFAGTPSVNDSYCASDSIRLDSTTGVLEFDISDVASSTEGSIGSIVVNAISDNIANITMTLNLSAINKPVQPLTVTMDGWTYGQTAKSPQYTLPDDATKLNVVYQLAGATDTTADVPTNAGSYSVIVSCETDLVKWQGSAEFTIARATPTGTPKYTAISASGKTLADAELTCEGADFSQAGSVKWVDIAEDGTVSELPADTEVLVNTAYSWQFIPNDTNYESITGSITPWRRSGGSKKHNTTTKTEETKDEAKDENKEEVKDETKDEVTTEFTDVPTGDYYTDAVAWAAAKGITGGVSTGKFAPHDGCTRAQIVTFLWRAAGQPEPSTTTNPFGDISADSYYYKAVLWAIERGITNGVTDGVFAPNDTCTRAQAVSFIYRNEQANGGGFTDAWMFRLPFDDLKDWCMEAVAWCYKENITGGTDASKFSPDDTCTRAQIVTFLWRAAGEAAAK